MTSTHPHENTTWPVPTGTPAHVAKALNDRTAYSGAVRSALYDILKEGLLEAALNMTPDMLADTYDLAPREGWAMHNAIREPSDHRQPPARRYELTADEAALVFGLLSDYCTQLRRSIGDAVIDGNYQGAADRAGVLRDALALAGRLNVEAHKEQDGRK